MSKTYVIKLGGSTISTKDNLFNFKYLDKLRVALQPSIVDGYKFFIVLGGGYTMRMYRDKAVDAGVDDITELHWIGTTVNVLNAMIAKAYFIDIADEEISRFEDYYDDSPINIKKSLKFGGGGRPGHSGDVDAILAARKLNAIKIYSLKNVDGVYSSDPKTDKEAVLKPILTWQSYLEIIGNKTSHEPGGNYPVDPVASRMAQDTGIEFDIIGAEDLENLKNALLGKEFFGSKITDNMM